jgi:ComEC/Rec2-related protein
MLTPFLMQRHYSYFFPLNLPPFVAVTFCLILGIWWQSFGLSFYIPLFLWLVLILMVFIKNNVVYSTKIILYSTSFLIGGASYQHHYHQYQRWFEKVSMQPLDLILTVQEKTQRDHRYLRFLTSCSINAVSLEGKYLTKSIDKKFIIYTSKNLPLEIGDQIALDAITLKNPLDREFTRYLMKENIGGTIMANTIDFTLLNRPDFSLNRFIGNLRNALRARLKAKLSPQTFNFFSLLFLGNKTISKRRLNYLKQEFKHWGISHYLARSGLHLILFILIWELVLKCIPISFIFKNFLLLGITCIYMLLSWTSLPFLRSFLLFIFYKIGVLANRYINPLHALALITLLLLILNPLHVFFLDFQLSFGITLILSWVSQVRSKQNIHLSLNS